MALTLGTRLGAYELLVPIGAGGMGELYRARDATLNRDVALKVLPELFALIPPGQTEPSTRTAPPIQGVLNWFEELRARVPPAK